MSKTYRALVGMSYPDGPEEYAKWIAGDRENTKRVRVEAGELVIDPPDCVLEEMRLCGRPMLEEVEDKRGTLKAVK